MKTEKVVYEDLWFQVEYTWSEEHPASLDFIATKIIAMAGSSEEDMLENELEAEPMLVGNVKWDGCMNVKIVDNEHFCGREQTSHFGEIFNKIYDKAVEVGCDDN